MRQRGIGYDWERNRCDGSGQQEKHELQGQRSTPAGACKLTDADVRIRTALRPASIQLIAECCSWFQEGSPQRAAMTTGAGGSLRKVRLGNVEAAYKNRIVAIGRTTSSLNPEIMAKLRHWIGCDHDAIIMVNTVLTEPYRADRNAIASTRAHPTMTREATAPAVILSFSRVV
jgi:hypothetical protein